MRVSDESKNSLQTFEIREQSHDKDIANARRFGNRAAVGGETFAGDPVDALG
jgi:hypothetical protein